MTSISRLLAPADYIQGPVDLARHLQLLQPLPDLDQTALLAEVEASGLTGRGGAAFPTATKMRTVAAARGRAVVVGNGGEGEPLSRKDRTLLSLVPHLVLDGATLAAHAVGAGEINICVHDLAIARQLRHAVADRQSADLLRAPIRVHDLPGHYVASEETAVIRSLNGGPALPAFTPPRPFEKGVRGRPTLVDNVETLAHIALIARYGADWFRTVGTTEAPGSALFTITGCVVQPGVRELALGTPLNQVLAAAGGPLDDIQAVLAGGYGGGWLPASALATPATQRHFTAQGAALGPGIIHALPTRACGIAETAAVLRWLAQQNAGQCGPCMFGLPAIADDFACLATGVSDIGRVRHRLQDRLNTIAGRGACRHPDGAVRLARSALQVFAGHLDQHQRHGPCMSAHRSFLVPSWQNDTTHPQEAVAS